MGPVTGGQPAVNNVSDRVIAAAPGEERKPAPKPLVAPYFLKPDQFQNMTDSPSVTRCKYGRRCSRANCWHLHPRGKDVDEQAVDRLHRPDSPVRPDEPCGRLHESKQGSSVHQMMRTHECPWPRQIGVDGGLNDFGYDGKGFALDFSNPVHPKAPVPLDDFVAVVDHWRASGIPICEAFTMASPGVIQARLGLQKGGGNPQIPRANHRKCPIELWKRFTGPHLQSSFDEVPMVLGTGVLS